MKPGGKSYKICSDIWRSDKKMNKIDRKKL